jgi:hypothetical protein
MRNLLASKGAAGSCPVANCSASLGKAASQWGELPYCPAHRIRIHAGTRTFVYYNGPDAASKRDAALRNILFATQYFRDNILGNSTKAETHRICHETSEDALSWNVFASLATAGVLPALMSRLSQVNVTSEPELYLWGLRIAFGESSAPVQFQPLANARLTFEKGISRFLTEPDIMLYVPGQLLVLVEAKFTSGNTLALSSATHDLLDEKPKSREGILQRYSPTKLPSGALLAPSSSGPFYSQLYRNLVFAIHMADQLGVRWGVVSLVGEKQRQQKGSEDEFQDPSRFIQGLLPEDSRDQFQCYSWERLYADHVAKATGLNQLGEYMYNKSANGDRAFAV